SQNVLEQTRNPRCDAVIAPPSAVPKYLHSWSFLVHSTGCLHLFKPGGNPLIFVADTPDMKCKDTLCKGHRDARNIHTVLLVGPLLQLVQIVRSEEHTSELQSR